MENLKKTVEETVEMKDVSGEQQEKQRKYGLVSILKDYLPYVLIGVLLSVGLRVVISPSVVVGESMEGSLHNGDYLLVYKLAYSDEKIPDYGDVVVLSSNEVAGEELFIKRVVGKPGDDIEIKAGELYRNGNKVKEGYAKEKMQSEDMNVSVPEGEVFLLGDNRNHSLDSRIIGSIDIEDEVIGKVVTRLKPFDQSYVAE
jgi:signal peptidase I